MAALHELQNAFLDYLLDDTETGITSTIESTPRRSASERVALYGVGYKLRLKEALCTDYERIHSYLGDALFDQLMLAYIDKYPSHHPNLRYFSKHMIQLVEQHPPFDQLPEVAELARIEQAFANSFDAADCECVTIARLAELQADEWATLGLKFHTAVQLLPQNYNSFQIWKALSSDETPPEKMADTAIWLIWRQDLVSRYRALSDAEACALGIAMHGGTFAELCESLLEFFSEDETPQQAAGFLQQWIQEQMICELV